MLNTTSYTVPKLSIREIISKLNDVDYIASPDIAYAASGTINERIPLLIEGQPGQGKTQLAKAVAKMLGLELIRVQMYDGITPDKIMYDYDYQRQLLTIEAIRSTLDGSLNGKTPEEAIQLASGIDFYGKQFLIRRPILPLSHLISLSFYCSTKWIRRAKSWNTRSLKCLMNSA